MKIDSRDLYNSFYKGHELLEKNINQYLDIECDIRILNLGWDICHAPKTFWSDIYSILKVATKKSKVILILSDWLKNKKEVNFNGLDVEVYFINTIKLTVYYEIFELKLSNYNTSWIPNKKFLFLTGKHYKKNRYELFKKFKDADLINKSIYSLFLPEDHPDYSYNCQLLTGRTLENNGIICHVSAIPYDHTIYSKTGFRVISETEYEYSVEHLYADGKDPWITEKTWLTMLNHHPFIMAGEKGTLDKLKRMGYKTFEEYLPYKYDNASDDHRLDLIVKNTEYWLNNLQMDTNIMNDIEHNYKLFKNTSLEDLALIKSMAKKYGLSENIKDIFHYINSFSFY